MGAAIPEIWLEKLMIPPTLPTLLWGAMSEGMDHPTGDAAERPPIEILIQIRACVGLCVFAAPKMPRPKAVPPTRTLLRTRLAFHPRRISASTSQPPMTRSVMVAKSHGRLV